MRLNPDTLSCAREASEESVPGSASCQCEHGLSVVAHTTIPALGKPKQERHCKIEASLGYPELDVSLFC